MYNSIHYVEDLSNVFTSLLWVITSLMVCYTVYAWGGAVEIFLIALCFSEIGVKRQPDAWATILKRTINLTSKYIFLYHFQA